jgi:hypothetical protein
MQTSQGQVAQFRGSAVLAWNDVIKVKGKGKQLGRQMTIFATTGRAVPDLPDETRIHEWGGEGSWRPNTDRAFDCMTARRLLMCR